MINYNAHDTKRINYALKVYTYAKIIGEAEKLSNENLQASEIAVILHDIRIKECERKYNKCGGFLQQIEGLIVAEKILRNYDIDKNTLNRILHLITHHHTFKDIDGLDYQILLESDLIVNAQEKHITEYAYNNAVNKLFVTQTGMGIAEVGL